MWACLWLYGGINLTLLIWFVLKRKALLKDILEGLYVISKTQKSVSTSSKNSEFNECHFSKNPRCTFLGEEKNLI